MTARAEEPLYRLMYNSHITPLAALDMEATMRDVLLSSHRWNRHRHVTGLLVSNGYWFLQAIEGPKAIVDACFERIKADDRHREQTVRFYDEIPARAFGVWTMCGLTLSAFEDGLLQPPDIEFNVWRTPPAQLLQFMRLIAVRYADTLNALHAKLGAETAPVDAAT